MFFVAVLTISLQAQIHYRNTNFVTIATDTRYTDMRGKRES